MNLDKASSGDTAAPLAPPDWTMVLERNGVYFTAEIQRAGVPRFRLSAFGVEADEAAVRRRLADKARWWIHEHLARNV